jgi:hypothetical protein
MTDPDTRACRLCDADGWRLVPGRRLIATPYEPCDHRQHGERPREIASPATRRAAMEQIRRVLTGAAP